MINPGLVLIFFLCSFGVLPGQNTLELKLIEVVRSQNWSEMDNLIQTGAHVNGKDSTGKSAIQYLDMWLSGWGDGGFSSQARAAEILIAYGAKIDPDLFENPYRVLEEANVKDYQATLKLLASDLNKRIDNHASDTAKYKFNDCEIIELNTIVTKAYLKTLIGCRYLHDGTEAIKGNATIFWDTEKKKIRAKGKEDSLREGRWFFFDQSGKRVGHADYYHGNVIQSRGIIYE